jgi:signal peptidase II
MTARLRRYRTFWALCLATIALDQLTKLVAFWKIPSSYANPPIEIIPGFFNLVHVYNKGAAFSILKGYGWLLVILAILALGAIYRWRRNFELEKPLTQWAFGLITGGIIGNVIDRIAHGHVMDFIEIILPFYGRWPAFNIADSGIFIGVTIYLYRSLFTPPTNRLD